MNHISNVITAFFEVVRNISKKKTNNSIQFELKYCKDIIFSMSFVPCMPPLQKVWSLLKPITQTDFWRLSTKFPHNILHFIFNISISNSYCFGERRCYETLLKNETFHFSFSLLVYIV